MVSRVVIGVLAISALLGGCGSPGEVSGDVSQKPKIDADAAAANGANAANLDQWAKANSNNGSPGESNK